MDKPKQTSGTKLFQTQLPVDKLNLNQASSAISTVSLQKFSIEVDNFKYKSIMQEAEFIKYAYENFSFHTCICKEIFMQFII